MRACMRVRPLCMRACVVGMCACVRALGEGEPVVKGGRRGVRGEGVICDFGRTMYMCVVSCVCVCVCMCGVCVPFI